MSVRAEDRTECSELAPARIEFLVCGLFDNAGKGRPVASDIGCPIRIAAESEIQPGGNLTRERPIAGVHVARPHCCADALLAEKRRPGQQKDTHAVCSCLPMVLHAEGMK